ncbi:ABC-three component system protein [Kitasatospora sp. NPDC052868]|uniref:ABC-three component system protein n=1 Tax=Kitasatospora sp. NPDC052868 TaxID=3364060 RepID=UPI0037CAABE0
MNFEQRMYARLKFLDLMAELDGAAFETFFQKVMQARHPGFLAVRTHGNLGDQGSDGLMLNSNRLYACYGPQTVSAKDIRKKFKDDLASARSQRPGQFTTFVFVHNDRRGVHPEVVTLLATARNDHSDLRFEELGSRVLWQELMQLDVVVAEDLLGCEIPVRPMAYSVGLEDLVPLLNHLTQLRAQADPLMELPQVHTDKLSYNQLDSESRESLKLGLRSVHLVEAFYAGGIRELEQDEVARGFRIYYEQVRQECADPEDVLWQLEMYVIGNAAQPPSRHRAAWVVLAHFFFRCDIFEAPPAGWSPAELARALQ